MNTSTPPPGSCILIVDDVPANLSLLIDTLEAAGHRVVAVPSGEVALQIAPEAKPDLVLMDVMMPQMDGFETCRRLKALAGVADAPVIFLTAKDEPKDVAAGFRAGGVDYIPKPFRPEEAVLRVETHLRIRHLTRAMHEKNAALEAEIRRRDRAERERDRSNARLRALAQHDAERWGVAGLLGQSPTFRRILDTIRKAADFGASRVLILGESGTGKELLARAIHAAGPRSDGPFVAVNCSAVPGELAESLFFGHAKGAFTGATADRPGYFELADGGTLFLDEISELPLPLQPKLLRALEETAITRVGDGQAHRVNTAILAASNAEFTERIAKGQFRPDLYFRLARFTVEVPPLRDRRDDIPLLARHFAQLFAREMNLAPPRISDAALRALEIYDFPGNVRELKNILERALMESEGAEVREQHLHFFGPARRPPPSAPEGSVPSTPDAPQTSPPEVPAADSSHDVRTDCKGAVDRGPSSSMVRGQVKEKQEASQTSAALPTEEARIVSFVRSHGTISNAEGRDMLDCDRNHANYLLHKLTATGHLVCEGHGRWARYRLPE